MQGIGIVRRDREDRRVETLRVSDLPVPLQRQRLREHLRGAGEEGMRKEPVRLSPLIRLEVLHRASPDPIWSRSG